MPTSALIVQLLEFTYDAAGQPLTLTLDNVIYYYLLNIQGDVMGLVDGSGNLMTAFSYTAYGKAYSINNVSGIGTTLASTNPLTYRGYILDTGTGHYYLQSRYYDPTLGRFINADAFASTGQGVSGYNMFAYCGNNPIIFADSSGAARIPCTAHINDGGYTLSVTFIDDDNEKSKKLKEYIDQSLPKSDGTVWTTIEYTGTYIERSDAIMNGVGFGIEIALAVAVKFGVPYASAALALWSTCATIYTGATLLSTSNLPDGEYDDWIVTQKWATCQFVGDRTDLVERVEHTCVTYYVWWDTQVGPDDWYVTEATYTFSSEIIPVQ